METYFLDEVEVGKSRSNLRLSERILLVWQLGRELSSCVFIEKRVPNRSKSSNPCGSVV